MNFDHPTPATQNGLGNVIRGWPRWMFCQAFEKHKLCSSWDILCIYIYVCIYIYIYIYIWYPPQNLCRLQFYWYLQWILYILAPILFRLNLRHQQWENWKTEKLKNQQWNSVFQFFSSRLLLKGENPKTEKLKNWKTEFHRSILLLWNSVFQFFSFSVFQF